MSLASGTGLQKGPQDFQLKELVKFPPEWLFQDLVAAHE
jgi:hypothetical protein